MELLTQLEELAGKMKVATGNYIAKSQTMESVSSHQQ